MSIQLVMPSNHLIPCRPLLLLPSIFPSIRVFSNSFTQGEHRGSRHHFIWAPSPLLIGTRGSIHLLCLKGLPTFLVHLRLRSVSRRNSRRRLVGGATCRKTLISWSALDKNLKAGYLFEGNPVYEGKKQRGTDTPMHQSTGVSADPKISWVSLFLSPLLSLDFPRDSFFRLWALKFF